MISVPHIAVSSLLDYAADTAKSSCRLARLAIYLGVGVVGLITANNPDFPLPMIEQ